METLKLTLRVCQEDRRRGTFRVPHTSRAIVASLFFPRIVPGASVCQRNLRFPWDIFRMIEAVAFGVQDGDFAGSASDEGCVLALAKK